jgi:hypothetical protein
MDWFGHIEYDIIGPVVEHTFESLSGIAVLFAVYIIAAIALWPRESEGV